MNGLDALDENFCTVVKDLWRRDFVDKDEMDNFALAIPNLNYVEANLTANANYYCRCSNCRSWMRICPNLMNDLEEMTGDDSLALLLMDEEQLLDFVGKFDQFSADVGAIDFGQNLVFPAMAGDFVIGVGDERQLKKCPYC